MIYKEADLLALFDEKDKLSAPERSGLMMAARMGERQFKELMEYWKDNHADADVRAAALSAYNTLSG